MPEAGSKPPDGRVLAIAADHAALALKEQLKAALGQWNLRFEDLGTFDERSCDYPDFAHALARGIAEGRYARGVLVCGTGIGMSIAANRHLGVRAALCADSFSARMARAHNDANVLCMGARVIGPGLAQEILRVFLETEFEGGRHAGRVAKIDSGAA